MSKWNKAGGKALNAKYRSYEKGGKQYARRGLNYAQTRPEEGQEKHENRAIFNAEGEISKTEALDRKDEFYESHKGGTNDREVHEYSLVLNPGEGRTDADLEAYTRNVMEKVQEVRAENGAEIEWSAVVHRNQSEHDHVHIYMTTDKRIQAEELRQLQSQEVTGDTWKEAEKQRDQQRELEQQSPPRELPADREVDELRAAQERQQEARQTTRQDARDWHEEQHGGREK